jgi:hypothetical protein
MKNFKILLMALVAMCGLNSCSDDCNHEYIEYDYSKELVGTWTCLKADFAEALVFKADGTFASVGVANGEYWEYPNATWTLKGNKLALSSVDYKSNVRLEIIPGNSLALVDEKGNRNVFNYCENDLADELVGMWVCNDGLTDGITIMSYSDNGKFTITTATALGSNNPLLNLESDYVVVGDLVFTKIPSANVMYTAARMVYTPNATSVGDIMTHQNFISTGSGLNEYVMPFLRINQSLNLAGKAYDYIASYITNAEGADKDIPFLDTKFNFAHMDGSIIDKFLKSVLYNVQFPDAKTFQYNCLLEGQNVSLQLPMEVEGNKITIKMSSRHEAYRDVVVYAFQDVDGCQFHMYMPTASFENFFSNLSLSILSASGQVDINNPVHVDAVYKEVADAIESINVSIVMK